MNENIEKIGMIGGRAIYADTGTDQIKIIQEEIKKRVAKKELQVGQKMFMRVDFGKPLTLEIKVKNGVL